MTEKDKLKKLKKLADAMYYAAQQLTTDASRLHKAMDEYHQFIINEYHKEEPVSEDLERAAEQDVCEVVNTCSATGIPNDHIPSWVQDAMINEFIHGAKWKEQQFEKNRLKHCDSITNEQAELESDFIDQHLDKYQRMATFLDAIEYGMRLQKQKLMAKAFDVTIAIPYPNCDCGYTQLVDSKEALPFGEKVKVLVIKE